MAKTDALKVLGDLVHTSEDGAKGFTEAAHITKDPKLRLLFEEFARECSNAVVELQNEVASLGGKLPEGGTTTGAMQRAWVNVKSTLGGGDLGLLEEVEKEEDRAKATYLDAAKSDLPPKVLALVKTQCSAMVSNHDRIRDLRNQYRAGAN
jgi:uncharacterized protein (TIGR02284 family)